jgi:hypothetical protein
VATAEVIHDPSTSAITEAAIPLLVRNVPGSTQGYEISSEAQTPVFFAPGSGFGLGVTVHLAGSIWRDLFRETVSGFYTSVAKNYMSWFIDVTERKSSVAWDRLNLELMRAASLQPNWDGEGAEPIPPNAVTTASILLSIAKNSTEQLAGGSTPSLPSLFPSVDGGITLKWIRGTKELKCTVFGNTVEVVRWRSLDAYESEGLWEVPVQEVGEHVEWLLR